MKKGKLFSLINDIFSLSYWRAIWLSIQGNDPQKSPTQRVELLLEDALATLLVLFGQLHSAATIGISKLVLLEKPVWLSTSSRPAYFISFIKQGCGFITQPGALFPRSNLPSNSIREYPKPLQRGLSMARGKLIAAEIQLCQRPHKEPIFWELVHSVQTHLRVLKASRYVRVEGEVERVIYLLPDEFTAEDYRKFLIESIRPASPALMMTLLKIMAQEKILPVNSQVTHSKHLHDIANQLRDYPYLAIWLGVQTLRKVHTDRNFPPAKEILRHTQIWSDYITDSFDFFAYTPTSKR